MDFHVSFSELYIFRLVLLLSSLFVVSSVNDSVKIIFGGDVEFSRLIKYLHDSRNCSYKNTLARLKPLTEDSDYVIANLETTLRRKGQILKKRPNKMVHMFSEESSLTSLKHIGITAVTLANNHVEDYQSEGVNLTIQSLDKYKIPYFGISSGKKPFQNFKPLILNKNGVKIGMLGFCYTIDCDQRAANARKKYDFGPALLNISYTINAVKKLRKDGCHVVVVFMHWDSEYTSVFSGVTYSFIKHLLQGAKIDVIVGSHPHVTHKHWYINNTLIATSLGNLFSTPYMQANMNFNSDIRESASDSFYENIAYKQASVMKDETNYGRLLKVEFNKKGIVKKTSEYIDTEIGVTTQHCLVTRKKHNSKWRVICRHDDPECVGTHDCNYLRCGGKNPFKYPLFFY